MASHLPVISCRLFFFIFLIQTRRPREFPWQAQEKAPDQSPLQIPQPVGLGFPACLTAMWTGLWPLGLTQERRNELLIRRRGQALQITMHAGFPRCLTATPSMPEA